MFLVLRSLLFLILVNMLFVNAPLGAEEPLRQPRQRTVTDDAPLLPRTRPDTTVLEGLSARFSSPGPTNSQITVEGTAQQIPSHLPPDSVGQTSFARPTTPAMSKPSERLYFEELPENSLHSNDTDYDGGELQDSPNEILDKQLYSRKSSKGGTGSAEDKKTSVSGLKNKLVKPELTPILSIGGSLLIVIAAFFLLAILLRKVSPKGNRPLPREAFECLGRYFLTQKHQLQVLRLGNRIVLVSVMPDGVSTLAEITDPDEAVTFLGLVRRLDSNSATEMFRNTVSRMSDDELSRPNQRPVVTSRRQGQSSGSLDLYSEPDESLVSMLARGRR